jgi:hypothetical protein
MTVASEAGFDASGFFRRKRWVAFGIPAVILAYFVYIFFAFDIPGLAERARMDNARILVADSYSYKTHVTRDNRMGGVTIAVEGENKGTWPEGRSPDWVTLESEDRTRVGLRHGHEVVIDGNTMRYDVPGYGVIAAEVSRSKGVVLDLPSESVPGWISASKTRVDITTEGGRVTLTRARTEVMRYHFGWELFWFTLDSPFYGKSFGELMGLAFSGERVVEGKSNLAAILHDIWNNRMWQHKDVMWAIFETVLMAFLGTMGAGIVALPLAFAAARNFSPLMAVRAGVRRVFDFVRGVDMDDHSRARLRSGAADRGAGDPAHRYGHLWQAVFRGAGERRQARDRGGAIDGREALAALPLWRDPADHAGAAEPASLLPRIEHPQRHHHRRDHRRRDRAVADAGDDHAKGLGRGELLHRAHSHHGDGDGYRLGLVAAAAHRLG